MTPRREPNDDVGSNRLAPTDSSTDTHDDDDTVLVRPSPNAPSFVRCVSKEAFCHPSASPPLSASEVNQQLNLHLGVPQLDPERHQTIRWIICFLDQLFLVRYWESHLFRLYDAIIPLHWKRVVTFWLWKHYLALHKRLVGNRTAIHPDASSEYHALTTIMWWGRYFPVSVNRMRMSLSQLTVLTRPASGKAAAAAVRVESIQEPCVLDSDPPEVQRDHCIVRGLYVHIHGNSSSAPTEYALFWVYGGAFLSGDAQGNLGAATRTGLAVGMDVFLPTHRWAPEALMSDIVWDICLAYRWFVQQRMRQGCDARKIVLLGISSGGGLVTRVLQTVAECTRRVPTHPPYLPAVMHMTVPHTTASNSSNNNNGLLPMPAGAVLLGPFCDYTEPTGSLQYYPQHDLIVTPRVMESGIPYLATHCDGGRRPHSPLHRSMKGLPPLCVVASQHEAVYDHCIGLVHAARAAGVPVTLGVWDYVCHAFPLLDHLIPEGQQAMEFAHDWLRQLIKEQQQ